jgi:hypothetical protein
MGQPDYEYEHANGDYGNNNSTNLISGMANNYRGERRKNSF